MKSYLPKLLALYLGLSPAIGAAETPDRSAFSLNLYHPMVESLLDSFRENLRAMLDVAQFIQDNRDEAGSQSPATITSLEAATARMGEHQGLIYIVLAGRAEGSEKIDIGEIIVVPDIVRLTLRARPAPPVSTGQQTAETMEAGPDEERVPPKGVELRVIESEHGDPPMFEITIDRELMEQGQ